MTVAVGDVITAAHINSIDTAATAALSHEEWTATSASVATNTIGSIGTLTRDAGSSNATMFTISTNTLTVSASGLYDISMATSIPVAATGSSLVRFSDGTNFYYLNGNTSSTTWGGSMVSGLRLPAATVLTFTWLHNSAASRVLTSRLFITKVGTY